MKISRRTLIGTAGIAALAPTPGPAASMPENKFEGKDTPKLCLAIGDGGGLGGGGRRGGTPPPAESPAPGLPELTPEAASARRLKQIGIDWVLSGGPRIPWEEARLREQMDRL